MELLASNAVKTAIGARNAEFQSRMLKVRQHKKLLNPEGGKRKRPDYSLKILYIMIILKRERM